MKIKPKKLKNLLHSISEKTGYSTEDISDLITCFYEDWVVQHLSNFENSILLIEHLGTFTFRLKKCESVIKELTSAKSHFLNKIKVKEDSNVPGEIINKWKVIVADIDSTVLKMSVLRDKMKSQKDIEVLRHKEKLKNYEYTKHMEKS